MITTWRWVESSVSEGRRSREEMKDEKLLREQEEDVTSRGATGTQRSLNNTTKWGDWSTGGTGIVVGLV